MHGVLRLSTRRWAVTFATALIGSAVCTTVWADQNLNCDAYAASAVEQQQRNLSMACLLSGTGWSANAKAHRAWCLLPGVHMADLTREQKAREASLQECVQRDIACGQYAIQAREQDRLNIELGCGFTGEHWSDNINAHRAWCMKTAPRIFKSMAYSWSNQLQQCRAEKATKPARHLEDLQKLPPLKK